MATPNHKERRRFARQAVGGSAAILSLGYLGVVYEVINISSAGMRLRGPKAPPAGVFGMLVHLSDRFLECRVQIAWQFDSDDVCVGVALESLLEPASFGLPERLLGTRASLMNMRRSDLPLSPPVVVQRIPQPKSGSEILRPPVMQLRRSPDTRSTPATTTTTESLWAPTAMLWDD